jgi:20S proteasome alpha/beta subunit
LNCSFHTDPSGTFVRYDAKAIGAGSDAAQASLQEAYNKVRSPLIPRSSISESASLLQNMTLDEAHKLALKILKQVMEEQVNENNVQLAQVSASSYANGIPADMGFKQVKPTGKGKEAQYEILTDAELKRLISEMQ